MLVEHLGFGTTVIRDTGTILPKTIDLLNKFETAIGDVIIPFPKTNFLIRISDLGIGFVFDIMDKNQEIAFYNVCCFDDKNSVQMFGYVQKMYSELCVYDAFRESFGSTPVQPKLPNWLYTVLINPEIVALDEITLAGEIEFYIYYSLYRLQKNRNARKN